MVKTTGRKSAGQGRKGGVSRDSHRRHSDNDLKRARRTKDAQRRLAEITARLDREVDIEADIPDADVDSGSSPDGPSVRAQIKVKEVDCGPLLRKIRAAARHERYATKVYLDLIPLCNGDFDAAMVLSQAIYWKDRAAYVAKDREGTPLMYENGKPIYRGWLVDRDRPGSTLGIPWRRFSRIVARLSKKTKNKKPVIRRSPTFRWRVSPNGAANSVWKVREGKWVLNVAMTKEIQAIVDAAEGKEGKPVSMPWAFRAMMANRKTPKGMQWNEGEISKGVRDIEDGNGAHLLLRLMKHHSKQKNRKWGCNRKRAGWRWSGDTREVWCETLGLRNVRQFDRLVESMPTLVKKRRGWDPCHYQELQLRPLLKNIKLRWLRYGKPFQKKLREGQ